ncbi:MAG TPA: STM4011 family radical SAM protein [Gemmataceae bacterium]|nr:STM4011 family radical SAM protein [Gemmataceae bacterium]
MKYHVLYRGDLSSCNYACGYCPFAKRAETHAQLENDRQGLERFLSWIAAQRHCRFGILFTPWGEALIRRWYQQALITLTHQAHVERAAIQTNLSCGLDWVHECRRDRLALWATFHPTEASLDHFVAKVHYLHAAQVRLSVGMVGLHEHFDAIASLRRQIPPDVYLWINAYKRTPDYYTHEQIGWLTDVDPLFPVNVQQHASLGEPCGAGENSFAVDGSGRMRRCHFVGMPIGSIHAPDWEAALRPRACPNATCGCHIGYVHLKRLRQDAIYGPGLLERIPEKVPGAFSAASGKATLRLQGIEEPTRNGAASHAMPCAQE